MPNETLRRSFIALYLTLGFALLYASIRTALHALAPASGAVDAHVGLLACVEALGAALFLVPRSVRLGGAVLLCTLGLATVVHAVGGQVRVDLLVYAAGTWFVMVHGAA
jgi:non-ribosomal peptide synthetase component F